MCYDFSLALPPYLPEMPQIVSRLSPRLPPMNPRHLKRPKQVNKLRIFSPPPVNLLPLRSTVELSKSKVPGQVQDSFYLDLSVMRSVVDMKYVQGEFENCQLFGNSHFQAPDQLHLFILVCAAESNARLNPKTCCSAACCTARWPVSGIK